MDVYQIIQTLNPILLTSDKLHYMCDILDQIFLWEYVDEEKKISGQKIYFNGYGDERGGNGAKVFASTLHCWYHNIVATFCLWLLTHDYHVEFQLVDFSVYVCDCGSIHVYGQTIM